MKILTEGVILISKDGTATAFGFEMDAHGTTVEAATEELKLEVARRILLAAQKCIVPFDWKDSIPRP